MGEILIGILREIIGGIIQGAMESLFLKYKKLTFGLISISWILSGCILVKMFADTEWWKILLVSGAIAVFATFIIELLIYLIGKVVGKFKWTMAQYQPKVRLQNPKDFDRWFTNGLKGEQSNLFDCE